MVNGRSPRRANRRSYVMRSCLGRGGFGAVYRATMKTEHGFQMDVALKFLNEQHNADPAVRGRLRSSAFETPAKQIANGSFCPRCSLRSQPWCLAACSMHPQLRLHSRT